MKHFIFLVTLFLCLGTEVASAVPAEAFDLPRVVAVEPRMYNPRYDVTAQVSFLPMDAFYKGIAAGITYTHSYTSSWSWEMINANLNFKSDTNLKSDLIENFDVRPQGILDHVEWYALTNLSYTPIYSKNLLFNSRLLYGSFSFVLGGGAVSFASGDTAAMAGGGVILRVFHSTGFSSKFDCRMYMHFAPDKSSDVIAMLTYGFSFELGDNRPLEK